LGSQHGRQHQELTEQLMADYAQESTGGFQPEQQQQPRFSDYDYPDYGNEMINHQQQRVESYDLPHQVERRASLLHRYMDSSRMNQQHHRFKRESNNNASDSGSTGSPVRHANESMGFFRGKLGISVSVLKSSSTAAASATETSTTSPSTLLPSTETVNNNNGTVSETTSTVSSSTTAAGVSSAQTEISTAASVSSSSVATNVTTLPA
jgi:hypothetical protein